LLALVVTFQRGLCVVVLLLGTLGATGIAGADQTAGESTIYIDKEYERIDERGVVAVTVTYEPGGEISRVRGRLTENTTVASTEGMRVQRDNGHRWLVWDGETRPASATIHVQANQTSDRFGGYTAYDAGDWAFVPSFDLYTRYWFAGDEEPTIERTRSVAGEGIAGSQRVYLGPYTEYNRTLEGETIRIVEPAVVDIENPQGRIDALSYAIKRLDVGAASVTTDSSGSRDEVTVFVVPDPLRVGNAFGADVMVNQNASIETWFHEYTHTRQLYDETDATRWTGEAIAEYYGTVLAWEYDKDIEHRRVERLFERAHDDRSVLSHPSTWGPTSDYKKGATAVAMLDARIRNETGGNATFQHTFRRLNRHEDPLENGTVRETSGAVAGSELDGYFSRYVYGRQSPSTSGYFLARGDQSTLSVSATARNDTVGEITVTVTNAGPDPAVDPTLTVVAPGARQVDLQSKTLDEIDPGESKTAIATLSAPPDTQVTEIVTVSVQNLSGNRTNTTVAVEYGVPEQTPTPTRTAAATTATAASGTPTIGADGERTTGPPPTGTGSVEDPNDDLLAGLGILVGSSVAVLGIVAGVLNVVVSFVWQSFLSRRTIYLTIAAGTLLVAVSSAAVII
jgi:hypothetical protein